MSIQQMLLGASGASGYLIDKSLRFRSSASAYLGRSPASATNRKTWTYSFWVKRGLLSSSTTYALFDVAPDSNNWFTLWFRNDAIGYDVSYVTTANRIMLSSAAVYRDPSSWYHVVVSVDTTQATATNRIRIYINGSEVTLNSYVVGSGYVAQNSDLSVNTTSGHRIAVRDQSPSRDLYFDGYMAEVNFIDGQALTPASFGSTNALTGVWQPAPYTGTYGTNGFYLDFEDTSSVAALGTDKSGNGNTWTVNNVSLTAGVTYDSMTDVPTLTSASAANYAVLNPLSFGTACSPTPMTVAGGNLNWSYNRSSSGATWMPGTIQIPANSKVYFEFSQTSFTTALGGEFGVCYTNVSPSSTNPTIWRTIAAFNGNKNSDTGSVAYGTSFAVNDICGVAVDMVNGKIFFSKNGVWQGSGDPVAGTNAAFTDLVSSGYNWLPVVNGSGGDSNAGSANFGQRPFAFSPPTGFVALNTFNLPTSTIVKGNTVMDATLYTGTAAAQTIANAAAFYPDLVWAKQRSGANNNIWVDSNRGATNFLVSNTNGAEATNSAVVSAIGSSGFTLGTDGTINGSGQTNVAWQWNAGSGSTSSNTDGSITSTVSVNAAAGFSIAKFTTQASGVGTFGHGLGVAPAFYMVTSRSAVSGRNIYHKSIGATQYLQMNTTAAAATDSSLWNNTAPTSTLITIGTAFAGGSTAICHAWSEIDGFSKFGIYIGNGVAAGTFVYTGFNPKFILIKSSSTTYAWFMEDSARNVYNGTSSILQANDSAAEVTGTAYNIDFLSNGFKLATPQGNINGSGATFIYMAFASNPFRNSLAR